MHDSTSHRDTLFDYRCSRNTDPDSSHEAADDIRKTGVCAAQCEAVYQAVVKWPGRTSAELAQLMGVSRYLPARRLPELELDGRVRRGAVRACTVSKTATGKGRAAVTWWAGEGKA